MIVTPNWITYIALKHFCQIISIFSVVGMKNWYFPVYVEKDAENVEFVKPSY